jgi:uncharacterized membrane protein
MLHDLGDGPFGLLAAMALNSHGEVAGTLGFHAAVRDTQAAVRDLGTLGGKASYPTAISETGRIVGVSEINPSNNAVRHGFIYDLPSGPMRDGTPGRLSQLLAVNTAGDAVGMYLDNTVADRAILWRDGAVIDLTDALADSSWRLVEASGINDRGQIVGLGLFNGAVRAFLLSHR